MARQAMATISHPKMNIRPIFALSFQPSFDASTRSYIPYIPTEKTRALVQEAKRSHSHNSSYETVNLVLNPTELEIIIRRSRAAFPSSSRILSLILTFSRRLQVGCMWLSHEISYMSLLLSKKR